MSSIVMEKMNADERLVQQFLISKNFDPQRFTVKENMSWGGTKDRHTKLPDFKVSAHNCFFYAEVKSLLAKPEDEPSSFNIFGRHIWEAIKQFESVNKTHIVPNVLIWVNHEMRYICQDLEMIYTGASTMSNGEIVRGFEKYSEGIIKQKKRCIDLHIWLNTNKKDDTPLFEEPSWFFSGDDNRSDHQKILQRLFGLKMEDFKYIHSRT
jgi:hypothetical protein